MELSTQTVKKIVREELPGLMKKDKKIRQFILELSKEPWDELKEKTGKLEKQTESRFDRLLDELRKDREEQSRKWEEQDRKWHEQNKKWDELRAEDKKKWEEQDRKWHEQNKRWEEHSRKWDELRVEDNKRWEENQKELFRLHQRHDSTLGALGARWGSRTEASFRNALQDILKNFNIKVMNIREYDEKGEVFDRPEDIELDIVIINGKRMICELKSSMSRADMYIFYKKAKFFEKIHQKKTDRYIVISPMVDQKAKEVAKELGITIYSYAQIMGDDLTL